MNACTTSSSMRTISAGPQDQEREDLAALIALRRVCDHAALTPTVLTVKNHSSHARRPQKRTIAVGPLLRSRRNEQRRCRTADHAGGAVSLVVILMVPVSAFRSRCGDGGATAPSC